MSAATNREWSINLKKMTCRNLKNDVVVAFERIGDGLYGKIKNIPLKLFIEKDEKQNWEVMLNVYINEASRAFMNEYTAVNF